MTRYITGMFNTIHPIEPVSVHPFSVMTHWRIFQLRGLRGLHDLWEGTPHAEL